MPKVTLDAATLLGGLAALFYFGELLTRVFKAGLLKSHTTGPNESPLASVRESSAYSMSANVALGLQWIITIYIFGHLSRGLPSVGILLPVWTVPLALVIRHFVVADEGVARIVGGIVGGMIGAAIAYARVDWAIPYGLSTGIFFGTLLAGRVSNPSRKTSLFSFIASTTLLLSALGVFQSIEFFAQPDGQAFIAASLTAGLWLSCTALARILPILRASGAGRQ